MPGFGIVAAVLGIIITMGAIAGPPSEVGHKVAAALVGTDPQREWVLHFVAIGVPAG